MIAAFKDWLARKFEQMAKALRGGVGGPGEE